MQKKTTQKHTNLKPKLNSMKNGITSKNQYNQNSGNSVGPPFGLIVLVVRPSIRLMGFMIMGGKPKNRTELRQKTANRIGFFPAEYRNHTRKRIKAMRTRGWACTAVRASIRNGIGQNS